MMQTMDYEAFCSHAEAVSNDDYSILTWIDLNYFLGTLTEAQFLRYMHYATRMYIDSSTFWAPKAY